MRIIHYPRVSSKKQSESGDSIEVQENRLNQHSKDNQDEVVGVYTDSGKSASISDDKMNISYNDGKLKVVIDVGKREGMKKILDEIDKDLWDGVKITKWDRFSRNNIFSKMVQIYFNKFNKKLIPTDDSVDPLMVEIKGALSEEEIRKMKERVRDTRLNQFSKGIIVGRCPYGYRPIFKDKKNRKGIIKIKLHPKESKIVREAFERTAKGESYRKICQDHKLKPQSYYNIIKNKVYYGVVIFEGEEKKGIHEPIISEELFIKCQKENLMKDILVLVLEK